MAGRLAQVHLARSDCRLLILCALIGMSKISDVGFTHSIASG